MVDYTRVVGAVTSGTGALTVQMPAGTLTGKFIGIIASHRNANAAELVTDPTSQGYTELAFAQPGTYKSLILWGKIGTSTEPSVTVEFSGTAARSAFAFSIESSDGWPAIGSIVAGYTTSNASNTSLNFSARTVTTNGNCAITFSKKATIDCTATSITPATNWSTLGYTCHNRGTGSSNLVLAGMMKTTGVSGNISTYNAALTGNTNNSASASLTIELIPAAAGPGSWTGTGVLASQSASTVGSGFRQTVNAASIKGQWDVNTRGQTGGTFYQHIATAGSYSATGGPALDTSNLFGALDFNGTTQYVTGALPSGLSNTFANTDFTMAVRFKASPTANFQIPFSFGNSTNIRRVGFAIAENTGVISAAFDAPSGTDLYLTAGAAVADGTWRVAALRRTTNKFDLFVDGVQVETQTVAVGAMDTLDQVNIGRRGGTSSTQWYLDGSVMWASVYSAALTDGEIEDLNKVLNPYLTDFDNGYEFAAAAPGTRFWEPVGTATGDQIIMKVESGAGIMSPAIAGFNPTAVPSKLDVWAWDISARALLERLNIEFYLGSSAVQDTFTDANGTAIASHSPDVDELGGGYTLVATRNSDPAPVGGATIEGNRLRLSLTHRGPEIETGSTTQDAQTRFYVSTGNERFGLHVRRVDGSNYLAVFVNVSGGVVTINQRHNGVALGQLPDGSADVDTAIGEHILRATAINEGASSFIDVYYDGLRVLTGISLITPTSALATKVGIFSSDVAFVPVEFDFFAVNSEFLDVTRVLTLNAATYYPTTGATQYIAASVDVGFSSAINTGSISNVGAAVSGGTLTTANLAVPALSAFALNGGHQFTPWYTNELVIVGDGVDSESTTMQFVPEFPSNYGLASGTLVYAPVGVLDGDPVYIDVQSGTGTIDPTTANVVATTTMSFTVYAYSMLASSWLEPRVVIDLEPPSTDPSELTLSSSYVSPGQEIECFIDPPLPSPVTNALINNIVVTVSPGATEAYCRVTVGVQTEFTSTGAFKNTRFNVPYEILLASSTSAVTSTVTIVPLQPTGFGTAGAGPYGYAPPGASVGNDAYIYKVSGAGRVDPVTFGYEAITQSVTQSYAFDININQWLPYREDTFVAPPIGVGEETYFPSQQVHVFIDPPVEYPTFVTIDGVTAAINVGSTPSEVILEVIGEAGFFTGDFNAVPWDTLLDLVVHFPTAPDMTTQVMFTAQTPKNEIGATYWDGVVTTTNGAFRFYTVGDYYFMNVYSGIVDALTADGTSGTRAVLDTHAYSVADQEWQNYGYEVVGPRMYIGPVTGIKSQPATMTGSGTVT